MVAGCYMPWCAYVTCLLVCVEYVYVRCVYTVLSIGLLSACMYECRYTCMLV